MLLSNILLNIAGSANPVTYNEKRDLPSVLHLGHVRMVRSIAPLKRMCTLTLRPKALMRHDQRQLTLNQSGHGGYEEVSVFAKQVHGLQEKSNNSPFLSLFN